MKRKMKLFTAIIAIMLIAAGCGSSKVNVTFNSKHAPLPDYVTNSSKMVKEAYIMASNYPEVVGQVPCYCGCEADGHKSNRDCFIQKMGSDNTVEAWDQHGVS